MSAVWCCVSSWADPTSSPVDRRRRRGALCQRVTCQGPAPPVGDRQCRPHKAECPALTRRHRAPAVTFLCRCPESAASPVHKRRYNAHRRRVRRAGSLLGAIHSFSLSRFCAEQNATHFSRAAAPQEQGSRNSSGHHSYCTICTWKWRDARHESSPFYEASKYLWGYVVPLCVRPMLPMWGLTR